MTLTDLTPNASPAWITKHRVLASLLLRWPESLPCEDHMVVIAERQRPYRSLWHSLLCIPMPSNESIGPNDFVKKILLGCTIWLLRKEYSSFKDSNRSHNFIPVCFNNKITTLPLSRVMWLLMADVQWLKHSTSLHHIILSIMSRC